MRKVNEYIKKNSKTETYVKLSDVHRELSEWCKLYSDKLENLSEIDKKYLHYLVNLLNNIEVNEDEYTNIEWVNNAIKRKK